MEIPLLDEKNNFKVYRLTTPNYHEAPADNAQLLWTPKHTAYTSFLR